MASTAAHSPLSRIMDHQAVLAQMSQTPEDGFSIRWRDFVLRSHFQPILSFSHRSIVGHEALIRASTSEGIGISPLDLLRQARQTEDLINLDRICRYLHLRQAAFLGLEGYLFLNMHPLALMHLPYSGADTFMQAVIAETGLSPDRLIIEITEDALADDSEFETSIAFLKQLGCRVALDDFGAGHSNFDRVWRVHPQVVKLDRGFALRAETSEDAQRLLPQIVELLHEAGSLVLLEGIETARQACIAMASDVDFAQGYHFGRPSPSGGDEPCVLAIIDEVWKSYDQTQADDSRRYRARLAPYLEALKDASVLLSNGASLTLSMQAFLNLPDAMRAYVLDEKGFQLGRNMARSLHSPPAGLTPHCDATRSRWSRRPYFRRALETPGEPCVTRPYLCITSARLCVTLSMSYRLKGHTQVLCGDLFWNGHSE
jgi:EAL domain-containing protein (putative c-di-GMP-specific phosphodiesterase class I)